VGEIVMFKKLWLWFERLLGLSFPEEDMESAKTQVIEIEEAGLGPMESIVMIVLVGEDMLPFEKIVEGVRGHILDPKNKTAFTFIPGNEEVFDAVRSLLHQGLLDKVRGGFQRRRRLKAVAG
jgi:hypothetical protein